MTPGPFLTRQRQPHLSSTARVCEAELLAPATLSHTGCPGLWAQHGLVLVWREVCGRVDLIGGTRRQSLQCGGKLGEPQECVSIRNGPKDPPQHTREVAHCPTSDPERAEGSSDHRDVLVWSLASSHGTQPHRSDKV